MSAGRSTALLSFAGEVTLVGATLTQLPNWSNPSRWNPLGPSCPRYLPLHLWAMQELLGSWCRFPPGDLAGASAPDCCHTPGRMESLGMLRGRN